MFFIRYRTVLLGGSLFKFLLLKITNICSVLSQGHLHALLIQQGKESGRLLADQLNAAAVVRVADVFPGEAL